MNIRITRQLATVVAIFTSLTATLSAIAAPETGAPLKPPATQSIVVAVTDEPGHIVRYRSPRFVAYTNNFVPGDWTLYHQHRNDLLAVIAGDTVAINQKLGGEPGEQSVPAGTVAFFPYADMPDGYVHRVSVGGAKPFINIGIDFPEPVPGPERRALVPAWDGIGVKAIAENRRGRAYRMELAGGQSLALPACGSALLVVVLSNATINFSSSGNEPSRWETASGDFKFFETSRPQQIGNAAASAASVIVFLAY